MSKRFKVLDLSGYMFSGKAAVHDFVSEIDGFWTSGNRNEFDLLRVKDGVSDLESAVVSWSPIRSDEAARRFLNVVSKMSGSNSGIGRLINPGFDYGSRYPEIVALSKKFIEDITVDKWKMYWPYHLLDMSPLDILIFKVKKKIFGIHDNVVYRLISGECFFDLLRDYLQDLISYGIDESIYHTILLNNAFEPVDPARFINYFHDARCIVVDRDPRDIFTAANQFSQGFNDQVSIYRKIAGAFDVNVFINRIKIYRSHVSKPDSSRILRIDFEDLVLNYEETSSRIYSFIGVDPSAHTNKFKYFDPEKSKKNVGIWRQCSDQDAIRMIERAFYDQK